MAYGKLQENQNIPGSYIIRECEENFENYYIDIVAYGKAAQTFKIKYEYKMWNLYGINFEAVRSYESLMDLARGVPSQYQQRVLLIPSEFG